MQTVAKPLNPLFFVVVANRTKARFFTFKNRALDLIQSFEHPDGRLKNSEIQSDSPGRTKDSFGSNRHSMMKENDPKAQESLRFSEVIAKTIALERSLRHFDKLILVAEPHFLGEIKKALDKPTERTLLETINLDIVQFESSELEKILQEKLLPLTS